VWPACRQALLLAVLVFAAVVQARALLVLRKPEQARGFPMPCTPLAPPACL